MRDRIESIDLLRGLVMVVMTLDHVRGYLCSPLLHINVHSPSMFLTRWITHFCAPVFVFLAGTSACLLEKNKKDRVYVARFLATRGAWLVFLELTVVYFAWSFNFAYDRIVLGVIWALGCSMVCLSLLIFLPRSILWVFVVVLIGGHNLLDGMALPSMTVLKNLWEVLHVSFSHLDGKPSLLVLYPLIPWIAVMAAGYLFGSILSEGAPERRKKLFFLGSLLTVSFFVLRFVSVYGDPSPWQKEGGFIESFLSFLNCTKYPPSLLYILMTLGPAILVLRLFDGTAPKILRPLLVFGRVPLFYYLLHLFWIHLLAVGLARIQTGDFRWILHSLGDFKPPANYGFSLVGIYLTWLFVVISLYPLCVWYADLKRRKKSVWLSYL